MISPALADAVVNHPVGEVAPGSLRTSSWQRRFLASDMLQTVVVALLFLVAAASVGASDRIIAVAPNVDGTLGGVFLLMMVTSLAWPNALFYWGFSRYVRRPIKSRLNFQVSTTTLHSVYGARQLYTQVKAEGSWKARREAYRLLLSVEEHAAAESALASKGAVLQVAGSTPVWDGPLSFRLERVYHAEEAAKSFSLMESVAAQMGD